ncbi:NAD(P)/FAD-dependent oxidoreductase [Photobacterium sp. GJ3]|uniref:NAD(P)/FAD-dependent oxidoreductase n=1 Tax=Photobacterium sp. GJ3 TaxID=2829502 RepID=UPI001B8D537D|nr:FAD/NAD(P)-binding oxidoreductase [Photobacterium sp. GJ3]QUJ66623.1 NAD(P)/FAD-dependent oxidoreductase [Photobacterium sp. GJ3]
MKSCYDVVIIGAGPAGIAAATALQKKGVTDILLLDRENEAGGVPRHCQHPTFGALVYKRPMKGHVFSEKILEACRNIDVITRATVVAIHQDGFLDISTPQGFKTIQGHRVILATGARETPRHPRCISGLRPLGVLTVGALQQFVYLTKQRPCNQPVIIGTDLVSFSALWTLRNAGIKCVAMIEENHRVTAYRPSEIFAKLLGVKIHKSTRLESIHGLERVEAITVKDKNNDLTTIACDAVIFSGEFVGENTLIKNSHLAYTPDTGCPIVDQYGRCSDNIYYAAGNMTHPADMGDQCYLEGLKIGQAVADSFLIDSIPTENKVMVHHGENIRFTVPSCFTLENTKHVDLNIRVSKAISGTIQICADDVVIHEKRGSFLPHRKISIKNVNLSHLDKMTQEIQIKIV